MVVAMTMLKVLNGNEFEAYNDINNMKGVKEVYRISGEFQLFVIFEGAHEIIIYCLIDAIKKRKDITAIWHILVSNEWDLTEYSLHPLRNRPLIVDLKD
ncbi:MAG: hypothetical protein MUO26_03015 [Methanotrichaceae archaeon]|nr:hypothetical protein [Methanotrichaceae archaeon]